MARTRWQRARHRSSADLARPHARTDREGVGRRAEVRRRRSLPLSPAHRSRCERIGHPQNGGQDRGEESRRRFACCAGVAWHRRRQRDGHDRAAREVHRCRAQSMSYRAHFERARRTQVRRHSYRQRDWHESRREEREASDQADRSDVPRSRHGGGGSRRAPRCRGRSLLGWHAFMEGDDLAS